jgi:hypothetical protein
MEQLVLLLIIAAISLVNWLIERSAKLREKRRLEKQARTTGAPIPEMEPAPDHGRSQEQIRELLESLGFPVPEEEPPLLPSTIDEPLFIQEEQIEPLPPLRPTPRPAIKKSSKKMGPVIATPNPWASRLKTPSGFREAVVLREIIGSPRSLAPY